jgi:hypothetical protein
LIQAANKTFAILASLLRPPKWRWLLSEDKRPAGLEGKIYWLDPAKETHHLKGLASSEETE